MEEEADDDAVTVDGDDSELSISVSVGEVSVEVSGRADQVELWYDVLKSDILDHVDEELVRAAAKSTGSPVVTPPTGDGSADESEVRANGDENTVETNDVASGDDETNKSTLDRTLPEYYKMAGGSDLAKKDRALLVGWFLAQRKDGTFTNTAVTEEAKDAQMTLGSNVSRDLRHQVGDGRISKVDESDGSPVYQMTITGEEYVEELLNTAE